MKKKEYFNEIKHLEEKYKIKEVRQKINKILKEYCLKLMVLSRDEQMYFITPDKNAVKFEE